MQICNDFVGPAKAEEAKRARDRKSYQKNIEERRLSAAARPNDRDELTWQHGE